MKLTRVLIVDDLRNIDTALISSNLSIESPHTHDFALVRNLDDANHLVSRNYVYDVWILDNDLGINKYGDKEEGYQFLKDWIREVPYKVPHIVKCCSANPVARENIERLVINFNLHRSEAV